MDRLDITTSGPRTRRWLAAAMAAGLLLSGCGSDDVGEDGDATAGSSYYRPGDLIEMIVPFDTGAGTDATARIVAPHLARVLGVDVEVVNIPGAGGVAGGNEFIGREPDGYSILVGTTSSHLAPAIGVANVEWTFADLVPLLGIPASGVIYAKSDSEFQEAADLTGAEQPRRLNYGGTPPTGQELRTLLLFEMLKTDLDAVLGYESTGARRIGWLQGEMDVSYDSASGWLENIESMVEGGEAVNLMSLGFLDENGELGADPGPFADLPHPAQVYQEVYGEPLRGPAYDAYKLMAALTINLNKSFTVPQGLPEQALAELTAAFEELTTDEEFLADAKTELGGYDVLGPAEVQSAWEVVKDVTVDVPEIQWLADWAKETYDADLSQ